MNSHFKFQSWVALSLVTLLTATLIGLGFSHPVLARGLPLPSNPPMERAVPVQPNLDSLADEPLLDKFVFLPIVRTGEGQGTLVVGRGGDSVLLDPGAVTDGESWRVICEVAEPLVRLDGRTTRPIPWLAESWQTADSRTWTFHLRHGVTFHDGSPLNASAVEWNFDRWRDPDNPYRFGRSFEYYAAEFGGDAAIDQINVIDDHTIQIVLHQAHADLLTKLSLCGAFSMNSPQAVMAQGSKYGTAAGSIVGSGAFKFSEWVSNDHITLVRNREWWSGLTGLKSIVFRTIPQESVRLSELLAGNIQTGDFASQPAANPNLTTYKLPALSTGYIAFQQCTLPFDKLLVRKAIAHAVNWEALVQSFYGGMGQVAGAFQPPTIFGSDPTIRPYAYDPVLARQFLTQAGYPDGFAMDFWYLPVTRSYFPSSRAIAEAIAADLAAVGVQVTLRTENWSNYLDDRSQGKLPVWMLGWGSDNGDPDNYLGWHFSHPVGQPKAEDCYNNDEVAQLLIRGRIEPDLDQRERLYQEAERLIHEDVARIPVAWASGWQVFRKEVKGYTPMVFRSGYERLWISSR